MAKVRAYGYKDSCNCFLPRDVLDVLDKATWARRGLVVVFATTTAEAFRHLSSVGLEPFSVRQLGLMHGRIPESLTEAGYDKNGAVYALPTNGRLVVAISQTASNRFVHVLGEIDRNGVFIPQGSAR